MKFFIYGAESDEQRDHVYGAIRTFAKETTGMDCTSRRIFSITYRHDGKDYHAEVGKPCPRAGEPVVAILEGRAFLVCTFNRGVARGMPVLVGDNEARSIVDFDPD